MLKLFRKQSSREKEEKLFAACELAYTRAKEETALLGVHLCRQDLLPSVSLYGPLGRKYVLPLDTVAFALQKKAEPFLEEKKGLLKSVLQKREAKGIVNKDEAPLRNWGWVDGKIVEIDFGSYEEWEES